ncbi:hypothetical protein IEQ34_012376 [Dendrobium chrysotoxum]|uniref:TFIIS N-terminal domain-containing protein n=1 Tax=Dendrobium chrysotoxum TaxID=161865 RepID=A0AAV7GTU0_DENCH|nr:hypothetical protein IEQ34_012376 [Dendrobium chrysotoxum]
MAMAMAIAETKDSLDYWRKFFSCAKSDIFELIDKAILVAVEDFPKEFNDRKNLIAEKVKNCHLSLNNGDDEHPKQEKNDFKSCDKPGENDQLVGEVMKIKEILSNNHLYESDSVLFESLRSLQLMQLSVETLKATEIGRTVNALRKHNCSRIQKLDRTLIKGWRVLVDEWAKPIAATSENNITDSISKLNEPSVSGFELVYSSKQTVKQRPSGYLPTGVKRKQLKEAPDASMKLEIAKWKLHEGYQRIENAKKQRMIKIIDPHDVPTDSHEKRRRSKMKLG